MTEKNKKDQGSRRLYSAQYKDKYEFVRKLYKDFCKIPANYYINTNRLSKAAVYRQALKGINSNCLTMPAMRF